MATDTTHECPAPGCNLRVPREQLACRGHWYALPKDLRDRIWSAYRNRQERTHWNAMREASSFWNATEQ